MLPLGRRAFLCFRRPHPANHDILPPTYTTLVIDMMNSDDGGLDSSPLAKLSAQYHRIWRQYQHQLDRITPYILHRWVATAGLVSIFVLRIVFSQGVSGCSFAHEQS